ncbi:MAG: glycosyl hydrolase family 18 protein [Parafilimonas sp.]
MIILSIAATTKTSAQFRIVGYLNTWDNFPNNAANLDYTKITHLNIAFANPDTSGNLTVFTGLSTVVNNAHAANVKVLMSLGGADLGRTKKNWKNLTQPENVQSFCTKLLNYVQSNNLDGLDIDIEGNIIGQNYGGFIQALSSVMKPKNKLVTAAVATWFEKQIPSSTFTYFDFVNIMSYDATGPWDPDHPGPHSPYSMAVSDLNFWASKGLPADKTGLGVPFYGWGFYNKFSQDEYAYGDLVKQYPGAQTEDQVADTIYYNGLHTIKRKTKLAMRKASGIMIWQLTEDAKGSKSLLNAINSTAHETIIKQERILITEAVQ